LAKYLILLLSFLLISCSEKSEEKKVTPKTGIELVSLGTSYFGGVLLGNYKDSAIKIINYDDKEVDINEDLVQPPFYIISKSYHCRDGKLDPISECILSIRFRPQEEGEYNLVYELDESNLNFSGFGLTTGVLVINDDTWHLGEIIAGQIYRKDFTLQNLGDLTIKSPKIELPNNISLVFNNCGNFMSAKQSCQFRLQSKFDNIGDYSHNILIDSDDGGFLNINYQSNVVPSDPSGLITFVEQPESLSANGDEFEFVINPIVDSFNNIVEENTKVIVNVNDNLLLLGGNEYFTENGKIRFKVRTKTIKGQGYISVLSGNASGFVSFDIDAGPAFGEINISSTVDEVTANGLTQLVLATDLIKDQYGNLVEDGTPVHFELFGDGSLSSGLTPKKFTNTTINGSTTVIVQSGTLAEVAKLKIYSGPIRNNLNEIVGYSANGEIDITFVSGPGYGEIPVIASVNSIYANNNPPEGINIPSETNLSIGPILDQFGNIVREGSEITVNINNGYNVSTTIPSEESTLYTDSQGFAYFKLIGQNNRGFINVNVSSAFATGSLDIWAYKKSRISYTNGGNVDIFFRHHNAQNKPSALLKWGKAIDPDASSFLDSDFYGYKKFSDEPRSEFSLLDNFPYFTWDCFYPAGDMLVGHFCKDPEELYTPLLKYTYQNKEVYDSLEVTGSAELIPNNTFSIQNKLDFWGGIVDNPTGALWVSDNTGMMWIDNRVNTTNENKSRGQSNWITIDPNKKYVLKFIMREMIGSDDNRLGEVGIIEGDASQIADPEYDIPPPMILKNDYDLGDMDIYHRLIYTPTGSSTVIKIHLSTRGSGSNAQIKFDDVSLSEIQTQNIHDLTTNQGPSIAYMSDIDKTLMFGGGSFSYDIIPSTLEGYPSTVYTDFENNSNTSIFSKVLDSSIGVLVTTYDDESTTDIGSVPSPRQSMSMASKPTSVYAFGGYTGGTYANAFNDLFEFNGLTSKWTELDIDGDPLLPEDFQKPSQRYQNGLMYIPELNTLYVLGGLSENEEIEGNWILKDDLWKINFNEGNQWKLVCDTCGLFEKTDFSDVGFLGYLLGVNPTESKLDNYINASDNIKRTNSIWHTATQQAYIINPETDNVKLFDPYEEKISLPNLLDGMYLLRDSFQIVYNDKTGRTYGYKRGTKGNGDSSIWYWDMNSNEKQYLKYRFKLEEFAKNYIQEVKIKVYGYGESMSYHNGFSVQKKGIESYIFNYDHSEWEIIGEHTFNNPQDMIVLDFEKQGLPSSQYVSSQGYVEVMVTPKGRPGYDGSESGMGEDLSNVDIGENQFLEPLKSLDLATSKASTCALTENYEVKCWGRNDYGQLGLGLSPTSIGESPNEMGNNLQSIELFDDSLPENSGLRVEKIFSGYNHYCALFNNKRIKCWGNNQYGQLGFVSTNDKVGDGFGEMGEGLPFIDLGTKDGTIGSDNVDVLSMALGENHSCALIQIAETGNSHKVKCWGRNNYGQLGLGNYTDQNGSSMGNNLPYLNFDDIYYTSLNSFADANVKSITSGLNHMCAVLQDNDNKEFVQCWGKNSEGQMGLTNDLNHKNNPIRVLLGNGYDIYKVKSGGNHSCIHYNDLIDKFTCWGDNQYGQLGRGGSNETFYIELPDSLDLNFKNAESILPNNYVSAYYDGIISSLDAKFYKLTQFDRIKAQKIELPHNSSHNIADQDFVLEFEIKPSLGEDMPIISKYSKETEPGKIAQAGGWYILIEDSGEIQFYTDSFGVIGKSNPIEDEEFNRIKIVSGYDSENNFKMIKFYKEENNEWIDITDPLFVANVTGINISDSTDSPIMIGAIYDEEIGLGPQRTKYYDGMIGYIFMKIGVDEFNYVLQQVSGSDILTETVELKDSVVDFQVGSYHSCVKLTSGELQCFGRNDYGQLGYDYNYDNVGSKLSDMRDNLPSVDLGDNQIISKITANDQNTCILNEDGFIKCWGYNGYGQLGDESTRDKGRGFPLVPGTNELKIDFVEFEGIF
jgi:alpha-tubulin suppressor-like RCC1 family protein